MDNLEQCDISYYGTHEQTIRFPVEPEFHLSNWQAGAELITDAMADRSISIGKRRDSSLFRDVPYRLILRFLRSYRFERGSLQGVTDFIERDRQR